jgi:hypothetical protein
MKKMLMLGLILGAAILSSRSQVAVAEESVGDKMQDAAGDAKTDMKKAGRGLKQTGRKAVGKDNIAKDAKDKMNDVGDDVSNGAEKAKRKAH